MTNIQIEINEKIYPSHGKAKEHIAIKNLRIYLDSEEFVCLVGPSGCGKTTFLNILAGLDTEFNGKIELTDEQDKPPVIGYVFQEPRLLPWRTVLENINLVLSPDQNQNHIAPLIDIMGLTEAQHVYPERLSLGMSRRVALARAFAIQPDLLLMDEPFVSLDPATTRRIRNLMIKVWQNRPHTILFVTHDLREAITLADRVLFLSPPPTTILHDIRIQTDRNQREDGAFIESFRSMLLSDYPDIKALQ